MDENYLNDLNEAIQQLTSNSQSFAFLETEEDLYSVADLKEVYNGQRRYL